MKGEVGIRLLVFTVVLGSVAVAEHLWPRRVRALRRAQRWPHNISLVGIGALSVRAVAPASVVSAGLLSETRGWGIFRRTDVRPAVAWTGSILILDLAIYAQHVAMHKVPWLWRLHRVHHADVDVDVTTGVRFHPLEFLLSLGLKAAVVIAIGAPAGAVLLFEVLLNATSMFNHANVRVPAAADRVVRLLLVTPDMHRVHHSLDRKEADHNYGFNVPWWDHAFNTYRAEPQRPHASMPLGVASFRSARDQRIDRLLVQPFAATPRADSTSQSAKFNL